MFKHTFTAIMLAGIVSLPVASYAKSMGAHDFVTKASIANEFEIESSKLALEKSQDHDVKTFAQHMIDDHTQTGHDMEDALESSKSGAKPAKNLDAKHEALMDKLESASADDFNRQYVDIQTEAHKNAVSLFSNYAKNGKDTALKDFAAKTLPALKGHLKHVRHLQKEL